jgi:phospholipid/cholesterol/gamma-HCH transport system substrate-binding protein
MMAALGRQLRGRFSDVIALIVLVLIGLATLLGILSQQKAALPGWIPAFGQDFFKLEAEFSTGQGIMAGQGQAITIAGVQVGKVSTVRLENGRAIIGMNIEPEYADLIHKDAEALIRPKTSLNDMNIDIEPGVGPEKVEEGYVLPVANTAPNINPEDFLQTFDGDTQDYLRLLLSGGAQGLSGDGGKELGGIFRRFYPFVRDVERLNSEVAKRRKALARVIHNFSLLTQELGRNEEIVRRWVSESSEALQPFADEADSIEAALREFPSTLQVTNKTLKTASELSVNLGPALTELIPQAKALGPALDATSEMFKETTPVLRDQIRPFTRQVMPVLKEAQRGSPGLRKSVWYFGDTATEFNKLFNLLAYNPGEQNPGYLFYLPWMNHAMNANYSTVDAAGPIRRALVLASCNTATLAEGFTNRTSYEAPPSHPFLLTLLQSVNFPAPVKLRPILRARGINVNSGNTKCGEERHDLPPLTP